MTRRADPDGIYLSEAARDYLTAFRRRFPRHDRLEDHGLAAGNGSFQPMTDTDDTDSDAQTYINVHLEAAHYAAPDSIAWTYLVRDGDNISREVSPRPP